MVRGLAALVIIIALVMPLVGCDSGSQAIEPRQWVPDVANMVMCLDVERASADGDLAGLWEWFIGEANDAEVAEGLRVMFGESPKEVLVFGDMAQTLTSAYDEASYMALVVRGDYNEDDIIQLLESDGSKDIEIEKRKGQKIYADDLDDFGVAFVSRNMYILGDLPAVWHSIDVAKTGEGRVGARVTNALKVHSGALFSMVMAITPDMREQMRDSMQADLGDTGLPFEMPGIEAWAEMDLVVLTLDKRGNSVSLESSITFTSAKHAESAGGLIDMFLVLFQFVPETEGIPEELLDLLDSIEITNTGALLRITLDTTVPEIEALIEAFEEYDPYDYYEEEEISPDSGYWPG